MSKCVNKSHPEFKELLLETNINPFVLAAKVGIWMETNNTEDFPTLENLDLPKLKSSEILYQGGPSRGRAVIKQARDLYYKEIKNKDLSENDIVNINSKLRRISEMIGDVPWKLANGPYGYFIVGYRN